MDTKPLEKFCPWARTKLIEAVHTSCVLNGLDDAGRAAAGIGAEVIGEHVLSPSERQQRDNLFKRIEEVGYEAFLEQEAYTWFNRFMGIRYMELHGYLPSGIRMLSGTDGSFNPACLQAAGELDLPGLDRDQAIDLAIAGERQELFRLILIAQCDQLADALPSVFDHVDDDALLLPHNLLDKDENSVLYHLVTDIPEETWHDVEVMGWMYQFYNSELKRKYFDSKRKAAVEDIPPATQLFTPDWIVRYMVDNSLGRLWMLNFPESRLAERAQAEDPADRLMEYYIAPDEEHEDVIRISGPEDITFCDPACGSGHILVYAFRLLFAMYQERGYREREIPSLILEKNLSGMEIDPRAAQIAELALAMCAREHDRRFFTRGVRADVRVLESVEIDADSLAPESPLRERSGLLEGLAHLSEIGSLFTPNEDDIAALEGELTESANDTIFASHTNERLEQALDMCRTLARRFDVVVANPPYMGGSSFNPFMSKWMKKHYPDSCKDLCTAFIERIFSMLEPDGYAGITGTNSWMFLSSFESLRNTIIDRHGIATLVQLSVHGFKGIAAQVCTGVFTKGHTDGAKGAYIRLNDFDHHSLQKPKTLEAVQNPGCGYFYRADATTFHDIPGSPIAYWASEAMLSAFTDSTMLSSRCLPKKGLSNGSKDEYVRYWWEPSFAALDRNATDEASAITHGKKWFPYNKGGDFRKWYGNDWYVINWADNGKEIKSNPKSYIRNERFYFKESVNWSSISSGRLAMRAKPTGYLFDGGTSPSLFGEHHALMAACAYLNSSVADAFSEVFSSTMAFEAGQLGMHPALYRDENIDISKPIALSKADWDSQETSWDFKRNPLL